MNKLVAALVTAIIFSLVTISVVRGEITPTMYSLYSYNVTEGMNTAIDKVIAGGSLPLLVDEGGSLDFVGLLSDVTESSAFEEDIVLLGTLYDVNGNEVIERALDTSGDTEYYIISVTIVVEVFYTEGVGLYGVIRNVTRLESIWCD